MLHYFSFDFCSTDESHSPVENLGQVIFGERIRPSPYKVELFKYFAIKISVKIDIFQFF